MGWAIVSFAASTREAARVCGAGVVGLGAEVVGEAGVEARLAVGQRAKRGRGGGEDCYCAPACVSGLGRDMDLRQLLISRPAQKGVTLDVLHPCLTSCVRRGVDGQPRVLPARSQPAAAACIERNRLSTAAARAPAATATSAAIPNTAGALPCCFHCHSAARAAATSALLPMVPYGPIWAHSCGWRCAA